MHGYLADKSCFGAQTKFFSDYFDCYAFDMPGFGDNPSMPYPYALDDYVRFVENYMSERGIVRPHVIAHSFGARVAVKAAAANANLFDKIVIVGGAGLKPRRKPSYYFKRLRFRVAKRFLPPEKLLKYYSSDYRALSPVMRESFKKIVGETLEESAKRVANRTLFVYGSLDDATPVYMGKKYHKYVADSRLSIIEGAGHFCFAEQPRVFNLLAREFLLSDGEGICRR